MTSDLIMLSGIAPYILAAKPPPSFLIPNSYAIREGALCMMFHAQRTFFMHLSLDMLK